MCCRHKRQHVLDATGGLEQQVTIGVGRIAAADERLHRRGPALTDAGQGANGGVILRLPRVDGPQDHLIFQDRVAHDRVGIDIAGCVERGHARENEGAIRPKHLHRPESELRGAHGFVHEIDAAYEVRKLLRGILRGDIGGADGFHHLRLGVRGRRARIDIRLETDIAQHHRSQQSHRAGPQHERAVTRQIALA